jgi:esterase/lipase superfamily enzyme
MYVVSCRRDFDSNQWFAAENAVRNYTNPANPTEFQPATFPELFALAEARHVCVLVHGFRNPLEHVVAAYWTILQGASQAGFASPDGYGLILGFAWPGFETRLGYFPAVPHANRAAGYLRALVRQLATHAHSVDVQTHSLGARVALQMLAAGEDAYVDQLMLTAAAVDANCLEPGREFAAALASCGRCWVYHSVNDDVLTLGYRVADLFTGFDRALGYRGPRSRKVTLEQCPNVNVVDCSARVPGHGGYREAPQYFTHWSEVFRGVQLPRYDEI